MNLRQTVLILAITGAFLAIISWGVMRARAQSPASGGEVIKRYQSTYETIDFQAASVKEGDESSVRALVDEVFNFPGSYPAIPSQIESVIKDRLVQTEMLYRQGGSPGVSEEKVVSLVNMMAGKLGMPDYTRTSGQQVRYLRMALAVAEPRFMGSGVARPDSSLADSIAPVMSPLQAAHLIAYLTTQKIISEEFQVSPAEWNEIPRPIPFAQPGGGPKQGRLRSNPKTTEMRNKFFQVGSSLTLQDAFDVVNQAFSVLGIDQKGDHKP